MFAGPALTLTVIALVAAALPAEREVSIDPMETRLAADHGKASHMKTRIVRRIISGRDPEARTRRPCVTLYYHLRSWHSILWVDQ